MSKFKDIINDINIDSVSPAVVRRLVVMIIAMIAWVCKMFDIVPPEIDESAIFNIVIVIFGIISFLQCYWKNNSWTQSAQIADSVMGMKREELKGADLNEKSK